MVFLLIFFSFIIKIYGEYFSKDYTATCNTSFCKEGLETCVIRDCYGARECKGIIDQDYPTCSRCVNDILDANTQVIISGNSYLVCDSSDSLQAKACLFYCRVYYYPFGECLKQNNVPVCKCTDKVPMTTLPATTLTTTPPLPTPIVPPFGTVLQTFIGHTNQVRALIVMPNGDIVSGSVGGTINIWNSTDGSLIFSIAAHTSTVLALQNLQNYEFASSSSDRFIKIWNSISGKHY